MGEARGAARTASGAACVARGAPRGPLFRTTQLLGCCALLSAGRIYRGSDSRYYCKRDDGTTGLIIGGISGAVLGTIIAPGESKVLGTIIGAGAGALIGRAIDDGDIVCR